MLEPVDSFHAFVGFFAAASVARYRQRIGRAFVWVRPAPARRCADQPCLRKGIRLHLSPDMDFGADGALWVPFYGVPAATVPALSRFAKLGRARVCALITRLVPGGYEVTLSAAWHDFPSEDLQADTLRMNQSLEQWIDQDPAQYYWVHKRFKTRPPGSPAMYG